MQHPDQMCRLQLHKLASEQLPGDPGLIEFYHLADDQADPDNQARRDGTNISSPLSTGSRLSSGHTYSPTRRDTKETKKCLSQ